MNPCSCTQDQRRGHTDIPLPARPFHRSSKQCTQSAACLPPTLCVKADEPLYYAEPGRLFASRRRPPRVTDTRDVNVDIIVHAPPALQPALPHAPAPKRLNRAMPTLVVR